MTPDELRALRARLGLTQEALAARLGVSTRQVAYYESGRSKLRSAALKTILAMVPEADEILIF